jgi:pimeloyl-ACP methyl ester carboxylesterase
MPTVAFIHGMFMTPHCWHGWIERFRGAGFTTSAPAWPLHGETPAAMRAKHPDPALGKLTLDEVVEHLAKEIQKLPEKPVLIGHSMGGLIVQLLLQKGLGTKGVAIDSAPPKGVLALKWSFFKANWAVISPFANKDQPFLPTLEQFRYAFAHTISDDELRAVYDTEVVPESRRVGNAPTTATAKIDFAAARPPLLVIAGELDHIIPAALNRKNHAAYKASAGVTDFHEFPGRTHYTLGQKGWEEVADYVLAWIKK